MTTQQLTNEMKTPSTSNMKEAEVSSARQVNETLHVQMKMSLWLATLIPPPPAAFHLI